MPPDNLNQNIICEVKQSPLTMEYQEFPIVDEWKYLMDAGKYTYKIENDTPDIEGTYKEQRVISRAFWTWQVTQKDLKFNLLRSSHSDPDFLIRFADASTEDYLKGKTESTLAFAELPHPLHDQRSLVFHDTPRQWWTMHGNNKRIFEPNLDSWITIRTWRILSTAIHEVGHLLGLRHQPNIPEAIMYPFYNGNVDLHLDDQQRIQKMYQKSTWTEKQWQILKIRMGLGLSHFH